MKKDRGFIFRLFHLIFLRKWKGASVSSARRRNQECRPACLCWGGASSSSRRAAALLYARAPARTRARAFAFAAGNGPPASTAAHDDNDDETHAPSATKSKTVCGPESSSRDEKKKKKKKKSHRTTGRIIAWLTPPLKKCETHDQGAIVVGMAEGGDEDITVTKLKLKSGDHVYVKTRWIEDESFCITILNGSLAWSYHMSEENVAEIASAWGISVEEFMESAGTRLRIQDPTSTYSFRVLDSNWTRALFSWTVAGRKVKLELKKEQDPAAINCNIFDLILEKVERLEAEQAEAEVSHAQHLPSRQNLDTLQKQNALKRLFTESQYTLTHFGPQNSSPIGPEFNALKPPPRNAQRTFVFGSSQNVISHINPEISQLETVCGPRQASCCNSVKDASFIHPSDFTFLGSQRSHLIEPPDTGIHCNKRPYSHCLQTTTNGDQESAFNHNKRRGTVTEDQATQVREQPCEGGGQVVLGDDIMRLLNCLTQLPAKVGAESARFGDRVLPNFKLARAPPVKDNEAHVIENREIGNLKKTNVGLKKGVSTNEALNLVDGLVSNACDVRSVPFRVSHGHTKDDAIVVSDSDNEDQEDDKRVPPFQSKESDRKGQEVQRGKKIGDESSGYRAVRGEGDWPNTVRCKEEDEGVPGNVPVERVVARIGDIDNMGSWSERQPLVTLQKYQKKLGIHNCAEASKGAGAGAEEQNIDSSLNEGTIPSSFHTGFRGVRESTAGKWSMWLKEAKNEFQEGTSWDCLGRRDTEPCRELEESAKVASSGKGGVTTQANSLEILPICKVHENHKVCLKTTVEALDLSNNTAYPAAKVPSTRNNHERLQTVNQRASIREDVSSRPFPTGVMNLNGVKVELVTEFCTEGKVEGNKEWKEGLQDEPEHISDDDVEEVPHMGHTSAQKLRNSSAKTVKSSQNECNGSQKAPGVLHQEHKKRGRPCSVAKRQAHAAKHTSPDAGAHTKFVTQDSQSESSDDDASIIEVKLDKSLHQEFQDGDYYKFEDDRAEERIKKDQIWALYDELDDMPRTWVRIMKVSRKPSFRAWFRWLEPLNLTLQERQWEQTNGYSPSCGEFKDGKDGRCNTITIFSHQMSVNALPNGHVQIYPNEGEVWAFHRNRNKSAAEKNIEKEGGGSEKPNGTDSAKEPSFRLVEILSSPGCGRSPEVQALGKLPGFRTFWAPAYKRGHLPPKHMHYFSHRVPAYRMTGNERMDVPPNCWDIDPAAIPKWESKVT